MTISTFYTADDGTLMLPCELPYGRYELIEVTTCHGYVLDTAPVPFAVDGSEAVVTVTKSNMAQKGVIRIQKTGEVFSSVEVQLGPQWAGVEFQLKTDAGLYPGTIAVGQDGILRTELGNSGSYVLSCLTLNAAVPAPGDIPSPDVTQQEQEPLTTGSTENADAASQNVQEQDSGRPTVGGIPVMHIILFGGGLLLAAGSLVAMRFIRNRRPSERSPYDPDDEDDDEDEYEY